MPKAYDDVLLPIVLWMFGEHGLVGMIVGIIVAMIAGLRMWWYLRKEDKKMPVLAKVSVLLSFAFGAILGAAILTVQFQLTQYASALEEKKAIAESKAAAETASMAKQKLEQEKLSPKYTKHTVRDWLDKAGYSTKEVDSGADKIFRLDVTSAEFNFVLYQSKDLPDVLSIDTRVVIKPHIREMLASMPQKKRENFLIEVKVELLRSGIEVGMLSEYKDKMLLKHYIDLHNQFVFDPDKRQAFMRELFRVKAAHAMLDVYYEKVRLAAAS